MFARFKAFPLRGRWILHRLAMQKTDEVSPQKAATYPWGVRVSSGHLREAEAPTEAVDLRGRGGSLCPPVKWNHPQSKSNSFGMNYRREGMEPLPYSAMVRFQR